MAELAHKETPVSPRAPESSIEASASGASVFPTRMSDETTQTGKDATEAFLARAKKAMRSKSAAATGMPFPERRNSRTEIRFQGANLSRVLMRSIFWRSMLGLRE